MAQAKVSIFESPEQQEVKGSDGDDELLNCIIIEKHALPAALVNGHDDNAVDDGVDTLTNRRRLKEDNIHTIPTNAFTCKCEDGKYYDLWSGSTREMSKIVDLHFQGIHPIPGKSQITVPSSACITSSTTPSHIDLLQVPDLILQDVPSSRNSRSSDDVTRGAYNILVIRVITGDDEPTSSKEQLSDDVFGTGILENDEYNLKSGYRMCSGNRLRLKPAVASGINDGVYEVVLSDNSNNIESGVVREWAEAALPSSITSVTDFFYYVLPPNVDFGSAAAWAYLPGDVSAYFDTYASIYIVMMHELGHNFGHGHSGLGDNEYGDYSCWMGSVEFRDEGPSACFNGAKSWWFDWYSKASYEPTLDALNLKLVGMNDYVAGEATSEHVVAVQLKEGEDELYVYYNKKEGINSGVAAYGDTVTISQQNGARQNSWHLAALNSGDEYVKTNWADSGRPLIIRVCSMEEGSPDYARVVVYVRNLNFAACTNDPTLSPIPTESPTTSAPSPQPLVSVKYWISSSSWQTLPSEGLESLGEPYKTGYVQTIDFKDETGEFAGSDREDDVAALFEGYLIFEENGDYELCIESDDGSKLFFDGSLVIDNDGLHGNVQLCANINTVGTHLIQIEYWERSGYSLLNFKWKRPSSSSLVVVPASAWSSTTTGPLVLAKYWESSLSWASLPSEGLMSLGEPYKMEYVDTIDFDDDMGEFAGSGRTDDVAASFEGYLVFEDAGDYELCLTSDDGSKLFFDGSLLIDNDGLHGDVQLCINKNTSGSHKILIEYWESGGYSSLKLEWKRPSSSSLVVVPASAWSTAPTCPPENAKDKFWTGQLKKSNGKMKPKKKSCKWLKKAGNFKINKYCSQTESYRTVLPAREVCTETCCGY